MVKDCGRRCSYCGSNGHNSRTCNGKGCVKLFGVNLVKSFSMGNLASCNNNAEQHSANAGYLSDDPMKGKSSHERKKGVPWTEEEHRTFLLGLKRLGKGDWRGISKDFVRTRTPTQVASHAQKYFLRQSGSEKKKRRSSLFDMPFKEPAPPRQVSPISPLNNTAEVLPEASTSASPVLPLKKAAKIRGQATSVQAQVANPITSHPMMLQRPQVIPMAPTCAPRGLPYMVGAGGNGQSFPNVSFVPMVHFPQPAGFVYVPRSHGSFPTCAPITPHPFGIPAPQLVLPHSSSQAGPATSNSTPSTDKDAALELKIAPPQNPQGVDLSSQPTGAIRVT
ncbi:hypothetical protein L1049_021274 [Liquidambar formosana]|uniref:Uncharacterized protein n=1 Tax=Liquidambar formosana TaxID=63359 RepID=A0AAP0SDU9_LIQFO